MKNSKKNFCQTIYKNCATINPFSKLIKIDYEKMYVRCLDENVMNIEIHAIFVLYTSLYIKINNSDCRISRQYIYSNITEYTLVHVEYISRR